METQKVVRIDYLRNDEVWDFEVEGLSNYVIGGTVSHNTGKSTSSMLRLFFHCTGEYPDDWGGARTVRGQDIWYAGDRWSTLRDSIQVKLFGRDLKNPGRFVAGDEPPYFDEDRIVKGSVRMGGEGAIESIKVKHVSGGISTITFKTYHMGVEGMASATIDGVCIDEEPDYNVLQELTMRVAVKEGWICATFTPLKGRSAYYKFLERLSTTHGTVRFIAQREVKHLSSKFRMAFEAAFAHDPGQLQARTEGKPVIDKGLVFPFDSNDIWIDYFPIPNDWPRVGGMDIGVGSPTTCLPIAIDPNTGDKFLYGRYSVPGLSARQNHFGILEAFGDLNISIDMAANQRSQDTAKSILDAYNEIVHGKGYRNSLRPEHWKYRPVPNRSFKVGHDLMLQELHQGKFYVLKDRPWLKNDPLGTSGFRDQFEEAEWDDSGDNIKDKHKFHDIDAWRYGMVGIGFASTIQMRRMIAGYRRPTPKVPDWVPTPGNLR